jgi:hypothetical protein
MHYSGISFAINNDIDQDDAANFVGVLYHSDIQSNHLMNEERFDDYKEIVMGSFHYWPPHREHKVFTRPYTHTHTT